MTILLLLRTITDIPPTPKLHFMLVHASPQRRAILPRPSQRSKGNNPRGNLALLKMQEWDLRHSIHSSASESDKSHVRLSLIDLQI